MNDLQRGNLMHESCIICDKPLSGKLAMVPDCGHVFHCSCFKPWIEFCKSIGDPYLCLHLNCNRKITEINVWNYNSETHEVSFFNKMDIDTFINTNLSEPSNPVSLQNDFLSGNGHLLFYVQ